MSEELPVPPADAAHKTAEVRRDPLAEGLLAPDTIVRGYRIVRVIRSGQSNNVYAALSPGGQEVAIKEYFPRKLARRLPSGRLGVPNEKSKIQFESGVKGFVNEAIALAEIKSDLLAQYVAAFRDNGTAYLITALEPGETLEQWARRLIRSKVFPSEADLRYIFWALLHAVQVMHEKGFLHLDIKPSNVIMRDENTPILIDLGGARRYPHTSANNAISVSNYTPGFAAPEQHAEKLQLFGPATDIYGIGSSILYCMTGKIPPLASERRKADNLGEYLARCHGRYSQQLIDVVGQCMGMSLDERISNIKELQNVISSQ
jgi:serine/threonine protein kinase